jgi:CMP-N-acetylneuraminic acid synthetase
MIGAHRVVCVIPARAGSKGIIGKNLRKVGGKPLIAWAIEVARATPEIDRVIVSTDGEEIAAAARSFGAEVMMRPAELATDSSATSDALRYHTRQLRQQGDDFHYLVLLEPTTPFRRPEDVTACLRLIEDQDLDSVATFAPTAGSPYWAFTIDGHQPKKLLEGGMVQRQQLPATYHLNGAVYVYVADRLPKDSVGIMFGKQGAIVMDRVRSIDIDDHLDLIFAEAVVERGLLDK